MVFRNLSILGFGLSIFLITYYYSPRFLDWLRFQSLGTRDYIVQKLSQMLITLPAHQVLMGLAGVSFVLGSLVFLACLPQLLKGLILGCLAAFVGWKLPKPIVDYLYEVRKNQFVLQMVDALGLMSNGLKSGLSLVQSMGLVTQEMPNPIQQEFSLVLSENQLGVSLEDSFLNLSKRMQSHDVEMFVNSVNILKETGGNLAETFDTIVQTIRDRIKVEKKIAALTAQGYYQGIFMMGIPPLLGIVFYFTDPENMRLLFVTPLGLGILILIGLLEFIAYAVILRVVKIDV